ncbi:unnamed protein product [Effrenium voratum]|uniref:Uncharacterized protein n=1 Tax=Effrenium voratum TaxID=2562239 RepID=A0AA36N743_9DINO|nr:unnamed protein product [Effrenium voratum]CAJ1459272.1 unnamed protein product [Effrenium voratum]
MCEKFDVAAFRRSVAAVNRPDEGMRGTSADAERLSAARRPEIAAALGKALASAETTDAAAALRSCLSGPAEGEAFCDAVARPLCDALAQPGIQQSALNWLLFALVRLAQFKSCQARLLDAGVAEVLLGLWRHDHGCVLGRFGDQTCNGERHDVLVCHILAFLSETGLETLARLVPVEAIDEFEKALAGRLQVPASETGVDSHPEAEELVKARCFYGFPLYYRPRFILQAVASLCQVSAPHAAYTSATRIPDMVAKLRKGEVSNDSHDNLPYGSPDAVELCEVLSDALVKHGAVCRG